MSNKNRKRKFDLNIEKILEAWGIHDALREIIANAIDEQVLTKTKDIKIFKEKDKWHIRDYGRGLNYHHFTQNENKEKLKNSDKVIGKFGIGLKDAIAVFDRHNVEVKIKSKHGDITFGIAQKEDFPDKRTLHAFFSEPSAKNFKGTEFVFEGVTNSQIEKAKDFFLKFSDEEVIENTQYGQVLRKNPKKNARIYIHGVRVAEEENYLFSYNITNLTKKMRDSMSRERKYLGRTAYAGRIKSMLTACRSKSVAKELVTDLEKFHSGSLHDELNYIDISTHACKLLNAEEKVVFVTPFELDIKRTMLDNAKDDGYRVVVIPENVKEKISLMKDEKGTPIRDLDQYKTEYMESFEFDFVDIKDLNNSEKKVYNKLAKIFDLIGGKPKMIKEVRISNTMRPDFNTLEETKGIWETPGNIIIINRKQLKNLEDFAGTLLHETAHATSGASDAERKFEQKLTEYLGKIANLGIN